MLKPNPLLAVLVLASGKFRCLSDKESACQAGDTGWITGLGRSPRGGNGIPLQYSCLGNSIGKGACEATVRGVTKSRTRLSD